MTLLNGDVFLTLGMVIIIAALAAYILRLFKQPQILAYVLSGVLITPVFKLVTNTDIIESMSLIGIAFLLFLVGLEIDLKKLKNVTLVSTLGGSIMIIITFVFSYLIALLLGFLNLEAGYIGLMLVFSSTMVVMKFLSDKRELNTLHGRIIVGILLLQDLIAIFALSILSSFNNLAKFFFGSAILKFLAMLAVAFLCSKYLFPRVFKFAAKYQELLLITSVAVCFIFSLAFHFIGFSVAIGAFVAGIVLGNLEYNLEIIGKVKSLRDFFSLLFFVSLGMGLSLGVFSKMWLPLIVLVLITIILKPAIIMTICSLFKFTKKTSFLTSNALGQMSEFSLIIAAQGLALGHISQDLFSLIVLVMLMTITTTSYTITHDNRLYRLFEPILKIFDFFTTEGLEYLPTKIKPTIILCGHNRIGYSILKGLNKVKKKILIIDYNPEVISEMIKKGYHCIYGEIADEEIIERMNLPKIEMLISTVPEISDNLFLLKKVRAVNKKAKLFLNANTIEEALKLYDNGADYVILPHFLGGEHASNLITDIRMKKIKLFEEKKTHISVLKERKNIGHEHPSEN
ncbi:MAG: cation:proton antiporter [Nanoarchaeota archaeon]|nr:cation:proton antiporter [Nanoarchaeota archaeon]MBU1643843.1 cation:proton antiporter [Nanoarchaeota archaeon]MBU1976326.1 cation:proton antiporter [Nanoarchaeota archaeon]